MTNTLIRIKPSKPSSPRSLFVALCAIPIAIGIFGCSGTPTTSGNSGGNSGIGGASSSGGNTSGGGSAGGDTCTYNGKTYGVGSQFTMSDGCNVCFCYGGSTPFVQCTTHVCLGSGGASSTTSTGGSAATGGAASIGNPCGGCAMGETCIFQNGGPGPSHYTCATQLPCGAMGACACIVNQGPCNFVPGDAAVAGICNCDNGLD